MSHTTTPANTAPTVAAVETRPAGPVVLDPSQWALVSGGAPKGGWGEDPTLPDGQNIETDPAPKGGW
jgi:hypothetical protein